MQPLPTALRRLEHLKQLVDEYDPIKFHSTERSRELAKQIPEAYGAVEDIYRHYAGDREVILEDGRHKKAFRNFFEAGWLSGRTFHANEGRTELEKVIGRVRADLEDQTALRLILTPLTMLGGFSTPESRWSHRSGFVRPSRGCSRSNAKGVGLCNPEPYPAARWP